MTKKRLKQILFRFKNKRIAVIGDFCLDFYWYIDEKLREISRETAKPTYPVVREEYDLGAAGNVAKNLKDLGVGRVFAIGIIGQDWRGEILVKLLKKKNIKANFLISVLERLTPCFIKPILLTLHPENWVKGTKYEASRLDFLNTKYPNKERELKVFNNLRKVLKRVDAVIVNDQIKFGLISPGLRKKLNDLAKKNPKIIFVADSRENISSYQHMILKSNKKDLTFSLKKLLGLRHPIVKGAAWLQKKVNMPLYLTMGERGVILFKSEGDSPRTGTVPNGMILEIPAVKVKGPIDTVGAGDTFISALTASLASGASSEEAGLVGNLAASCSIKKLFQTGTATPKEILKIKGDRHFFLPNKF